ncbi:MAG: helix-turn-helix transcriptional regulator [Clostridiales bacterium]|nr:helix-turn-helix transcriptional regulator [Clostridiales bacterium]
MFSCYDFKEFGQKVKKIRLSAGFTQKDVRNLIGLNEDTLRKIENGFVIPKYETLELLSSLYKKDLLIVLSKERKQNELYNLYNDLDDLIINFNQGTFEQLSLKLQLIHQQHATDLISQHEITQLKILLEAINDYFTDSQSDISYLIDKLLPTFSLVNNEYDFAKYSQFKYSIIEIRILILIGLVYVKLENIIKSNDILIFCLDYLLQVSTLTIEMSKLIIKIYYNISYNFHRLDNHQKALDYAILGIEYTKNIQTTYSLPYLLARKAFAQYFLNIEEYQNTFLQTVKLLEVMDDRESIDMFKDVALNRYGIKIDI